MLLLFGSISDWLIDTESDILNFDLNNLRKCINFIAKTDENH